MHVHCPYCNHSFNLSRDFLVFAVAEVAEKKQRYYGVECINCRKTIKISTKQLKRYAPAAPAAEEKAEE